MKSNIEIFDKEGKALNIADVISRYLVEQAKERNLDAFDLLLGIDYSGEDSDWLVELELMDIDTRIIAVTLAKKPNGL